MDIVAGHKALARRLRAPAVAIGNFDGVHLGHQRLFAESRTAAARLGGQAVVLTFHPHPARLLAPALAPALITTEARRLELIAAAGIDVCVVEPFDEKLAALSPEAFVGQILVEGLGALQVCVGADFTFGQGRAGTGRDLTDLCRARAVEVQIVPQVSANGVVCSSTKVREFVLAGRLDGARLLLGRDHELEGLVVTGLGRGRSIGVPTANLEPDTELVPYPGVYAGWAQVVGEAQPARRWAAAVNIGCSPTFGEGARRVEAHLLDYTGLPLVRARLRLGLCQRLRAERRFPSSEALVEQIQRDIVATRALVAARLER